MTNKEKLLKHMENRYGIKLINQKYKIKWWLNKYHMENYEENYITLALEDVHLFFMDRCGIMIQKSTTTGIEWVYEIPLFYGRGMFKVMLEELDYHLMEECGLRLSSENKIVTLAEWRQEQIKDILQ